MLRQSNQGRHSLIQHTIANGNRARLFHIEATRIGDGHLGILKLLLAHNAAIDTLAPDGRTALSVAVDHGQIECAKALVAANAVVNKAADGTPAPITKGAANVDLVKLFLEHGASVNDDRGLNGMTPLHGAAQNAAVDAVALLLKHGASVNAKTQNGETPLVLAARRGSAEVIKLLIAAGADVNEGVVRPLAIAAQGKKTDVVKVLLDPRFWPNLEEVVFNTEHAMLRLINRHGSFQLR
eukprot:m.8262 g.8262  ORF g.8262 m.8262 type:complete len:239 (-) comp4042_c0_seq1:319-1035(-)